MRSSWYILWYTTYPLCKVELKGQMEPVPTSSPVMLFASSRVEKQESRMYVTFLVIDQVKGSMDRQNHAQNIPRG